MALLNNLSNYKNLGLLLVRIGLGITFIHYGYPMLMGGPHGWKETGYATRYIGINFLPVAWGFLAAVTETFGGFLLIIGMAFRPVCLLLCITLVIATSTHLGKGEGFSGAVHAIEDAFIFAGLLFVGPGKYSVDKK
jgi:putative oxidoreductase